LPCPDRSDRSPFQVLKKDWLSSLHKAGLDHLERNKRDLLNLLAKFESSVLTEARASVVEKLKTKFGRRFRQHDTNRDLEDLRRSLEQAATLRSNPPNAAAAAKAHPIPAAAAISTSVEPAATATVVEPMVEASAAPPTPTASATAVAEPMVEEIEQPTVSEHPRNKRAAPTPSPDRDHGRCSKHMLIELTSVSPTAGNEAKAPAADPIGFSLAETGDSPATAGFGRKTRDPDVEPSSDEESDERFMRVPPPPPRFNPLTTTAAEVYVDLSDDEEDHVVDSQATIIYTQEVAKDDEEDSVADSQATIIYSQEEATSKEVLPPSKIPLQQKQLKQTTLLSKGSLSQPTTTNPIVSLPRLSLTADRRLSSSQGNCKSVKRTDKT
jgi:hypothetical protein